MCVRDRAGYPPVVTLDVPDAPGPADAPPLRGRKIAGRYRLDDVIGTGGVGTVWAATDEVLDRPVAVKDVVAPHWFGADEQESLRERTLREARATARIGQHPNVVTVYDVVEQDDRLWIVMQLVQARSLAQLIDEDGPCRPAEAARIGIQVLDGLRAAHSHGILHRDVKPSNVLVDEDGRAILTDFGIAAIEGDATLTGTGVLMGAPAYIAPERTQGSPAAAASDLWALGATLYTAVEGKPPFQRDGAFATLAAAIDDDPDPAEHAGELEPLLLALLRRDPADRPDYDEITRDLWRIAVSSSSQAAAEALDGFDAATWPNAVAVPVRQHTTDESSVPAAAAVPAAAVPAAAVAPAPAPPGDVVEPTVITPRPAARPRRSRSRLRAGLPAAASAVGLAAASLLAFLTWQSTAGTDQDPPTQEFVDTAPDIPGVQPGVSEQEPAAVRQPAPGADVPAVRRPSSSAATPPAGSPDGGAPAASEPPAGPSTTGTPSPEPTTEPPPDPTTDPTTAPPTTTESTEPGDPTTAAPDPTEAGPPLP